jgi:hypothetical protein
MVSVRVVVDYVVPLVGQRHMEQVSIKETVEVDTARISRGPDSREDEI